MSREIIPSTMRALNLSEYQSGIPRALTVIEKPVPHPGPGQVLVRIEASPCNPSDLMFLQGRYNVVKTLPCVPGFEGGGRVVASGGGLMGRMLMGRRVACGGQGDSDGTWAEYFLAEAKSCLPLKKNVPMEQGACMIVNPLTAVGLLDTARSYNKSVGGGRALVQSAAASQLGRMVIKLARTAGFETINIVRREEQAELLRRMGARHVLDENDSEFYNKLAELSADLKATTALDPIAGANTGRLMKLLPDKSNVVVYGSLSGEPAGDISASQLSARGKIVSGFHLARWIQTRGMIYVTRAAGRMQKLMAKGEIKTEIRRRAKFEDVREALAEYAENMTAGKVLIVP